MATISFDQDVDTWLAPRWAFDSYLRSVQEDLRGMEVLSGMIEQARALDGLHFSLVDSHITAQLLPIMIQVAEAVVAGTRPARAGGRALDGESQGQFRDLVGSLLVVLRRQV